MLRALGVAQLLAALSAGATSALLVVYAREALEVTGYGYGLLLSAIGVGAALARSCCCASSAHHGGRRWCSGRSPCGGCST